MHATHGYRISPWFLMSCDFRRPNLWWRSQVQLGTASMLIENSRKTGKALDFEYCSFFLCLPSPALAPDAEEGLLDFSVSLAFLDFTLLESLPLRASGARLLERDLIRVSLVAFFISLPLSAASGARLLERDLVLVLETDLSATFVMTRCQV